MSGFRVFPRLRQGVLVLTVAALSGIAVLGATQMASAQGATPTPSHAPATVYVNGHGSVTLKPDTASIVVGVNIIEHTLGAAQEKATARMTAVINALKAAGIAEDDIQTVNYSVNILQDYDQNGNPATIKGFQVSNQVNVTVRDLTKVGSLLDTLVAQGANTIYGISFFVNDPTAGASKARELAVRDAKKKADELAAAAGMKVGRVVSISEGSTALPPPMAFSEAAPKAAGNAVPIQAGSSMISVDVQITYELV